jgi:hypothetical protein
VFVKGMYIGDVVVKEGRIRATPIQIRPCFCEDPDPQSVALAQKYSKPVSDLFLA